ncbi:MAG TPA: M17 family peptidase N-terminal domain-containing protein, partial [Methylovirgula sp.]
MSQPIKIDFVALAPVTAQTPPQGAGKRGGKTVAPQTLVIFMGQDFTFGPATQTLIGTEGEAMIRRAAGAIKFKAKEQSALDIVAPSGFIVDRLLVIGTGPAADEPAKAHGKAAKTSEANVEAVEKPADYVGLGGSVLGKLGAGASALVAFDLPRPPKDAAAAAAEFAEGMRLRDYKFDLYKTKKKDDDDGAGTDISVAVDDPAAARREAKGRDAEAEGVVIARTLVNEPANV